MIRTHVGKAAFLFAAAALGASAAMVGCSRHAGPADDVGAVTVALTLSPGVIVNTVSYSITGNGITAITGTIDVTNSAHATALVSGIAPGNGYLLSMDATSTDGKTICHGQTNFNSIAGQTASATVILQCRGPGGVTTGTVAINGRLDNCPFITGFSASALEASVGSSVNIAVTATDLDPADTITYTWTATPAGIGTVAAPGSASTTFTCTAVGATSLSIAISDGVCGDSLSNIIPINCLAGSVGGTGGVAGNPGTGGVAGNPGTGGVAGMGMGGSGMGGMIMCNEPVSGSPQACCDCTNAPGNCSLAPNPDGTDGCEGLSDPNDKALCATLAQCYSAPTHPGNTVSPGACTTSGDATRCFCGSSGTSCFSSPGAANGPCTAQVFAAAKTMDPATIQGVFNSAASPVGRAFNLIACQGIFCATECAIK